MGDYSPEPPRRDCIVHHTFDAVEMDKVIDISPQGNDGKIIGNVTLGHPGIIGSAARMESRDAEVEIDAASQFYPTPATTISGWAKSERPVAAGTRNVKAEIKVSGTVYSLSHNLSEQVDSWQFAALDYDGEDAYLYYARPGEAVRQVDSLTIGGDVEEASITHTTNGYGFVDDARLYRDTIGLSNIRGLFEIGNEHNSLNRVADHWNNAGIPFITGEPNARVGGALAESDDKTFRTLDAIREARHIDDAAGEHLDNIGDGFGVIRQDGEEDPQYRARIKGTLAAGRSAGTFEDLLQAAAIIVETTTDRVFIDERYSTDPATAFIYLRSTDLDDAQLSASDITELLKDAVPGGHDVEARRQGANPFEVKNDQQANDSSKGLTSDTIGTGGGLTSDV